jgi:hypothetical protein
MRRFSNTFNTPTWAKPRAPPPDKARQIFGDLIAGVVAVRLSAVAVWVRQENVKIIKARHVCIEILRNKGEVQGKRYCKRGILFAGSIYY